MACAVVATILFPERVQWLTLSFFKKHISNEEFSYLFSQQNLSLHSHWELLGTTSLVQPATVKLLWNNWEWSALPKGNSTVAEDKSFFSFISAAQIPSGSDLPVRDPLLLPLSYCKPIVQVHNGCLCAFSLLPILNSRSPALSLQYVQCKWQQTEWW